MAFGKDCGTLTSKWFARFKLTVDRWSYLEAGRLFDAQCLTHLDDPASQSLSRVIFGVRPDSLVLPQSPRHPFPSNFKPFNTRRMA
jgi:hypothetical protein